MERVYRGEALGIKVELVGIMVIPNTSLIQPPIPEEQKKISRLWHQYLRVNGNILQNLCLPILQCGRVYRGEALGIKYRVCWNFCQNTLCHSKQLNFPFPKGKQFSTSSAHICKLLQNLYQPNVQCGRVYRGGGLRHQSRVCWNLCQNTLCPWLS